MTGYDLLAWWDPTLNLPENWLQREISQVKLTEIAIPFIEEQYSDTVSIGVWPNDPGLSLSHIGRLRALKALRLGQPVGNGFEVFPFLKLVTYVPLGYEDRVRNAIFGAGAGHIGQYSHCAFVTRGEGTFLPLPGSQPLLGQEGKLEYVSELRLETIVPHWLKKRVQNALVRSHPYEEVALDWMALQNSVVLYEGYQDVQGVWRCGEATDDVVSQAIRHHVPRLICEKISWENRVRLKMTNVLVNIVELGEILLAGAEQLGKDKTQLWE